MEFLHFDPITLLVLIVGLIGGWTTLKNNTSWHSKWIRKHDEECNEYKVRANEILTELKVSNERLAQIAVNNTQRIERIEHQMDKSR